MTPAEFVKKRKISGGAETAKSQLFLTELCLLLDLPAPDATSQNKEEDRYVFEKSVTLNNGDGAYSPVRHACLEAAVPRSVTTEGFSLFQFVSASLCYRENAFSLSVECHVVAI